MHLQMEHDLFVYGDDEGLAGRIGEFLRAGVEEGSETIMVVDRRKSELLRDALGTGADVVQVIDCESHYTRPEAALADYDLTLRRLTRDGVRSVRLFGELPTLDAPPEYRPWISYEAILNRAFTHHPVWIMCGYDTRVVPDSVMGDIRRAHPRVLGETLQPAAEYSEPAELVRAHTPAPAAQLELEPLEHEQGTLAFRRRLRRRMAEHEVPEADADAMVMAATEVLANAEHHGRGVRSTRASRVDGRFVLEIADSGPGLHDPLAGYLPPTEDPDRGAGMWVARQLTERLEMLDGGDGTTIRLWI